MKFYRYCVIAALLGPAVARGQIGDTLRGRTEADEGVEVLTRGPVHEAFAGTVTFDPQPGVVVEQTPPAAIEELPPEQKPGGANVAWIPGYWAWDDDSSNFLWISGIWRSLPPGRQWVPGYWAQAGRGFQWISGYWADAGLTEAEYLPEPPESIEAGPNIDAPSADYTWLPGCWIWQQNRYAWRPGFWTQGQPNWVWTPAHYQWTPRGYIYVDGYWDYDVQRRGVLFAPVSFNQRVYSQRGFVYTPSTVIDLGVFASHLFLRPNYGHYYYGDYYGANYATAGFYPWFSFSSGRHGYDPIYAHQRWDHRQDRDWERHVHSNFQYRRDHEDARPPRTFAAQQDLSRSGRTGQDKSRVIAQPLERYMKDRDGAVRFQPVTKDDRQQFGRLGQEVRTYREERQKREAKPAVNPTNERPARQFKPEHDKLLRSPLVAAKADELGNNQGPPKAHDLPQLDPGIAPKPRRSTPRTDPRQPREVRPKSQPQPKPQSRPELQRKPQPEVKPKPQPQPRREAKPQRQPKLPTVAPKPKSPKVVPKSQSPKSGPKEKPEGRQEKPGS